MIGFVRLVARDFEVTFRQFMARDVRHGTRHPRGAAFFVPDAQAPRAHPYLAAAFRAHAELGVVGRAVPGVVFELGDDRIAVFRMQALLELLVAGREGRVGDAQDFRNLSDQKSWFVRTSQSQMPSFDPRTASLVTLFALRDDNGVSPGENRKNGDVRGPEDRQNSVVRQ